MPKVWRCGLKCAFWEADPIPEAPNFGWCQAPIPWDILFSAGDMLHTNSGDECGWTLEKMIEAYKAWEPVIAARKELEATLDAGQ